MSIFLLFLQDGKEDKTNDGKTTITKSLESVPLGDALAYIVALDVKWYFNLMRIVEGVRDTYALTLDTITKNDKKIRLPRGAQDRGHMSMF